MTVDATTAPPIKSRPTRTTESARRKALRTEIERELVRWEPEEVVAKRLLPYKSARVLREKCYRREVFHHLDGGRITFTEDDIRRENARQQVHPIAA